jgi:hypothetical protein
MRRLFHLNPRYRRPRLPDDDLEEVPQVGDALNLVLPRIRENRPDSAVRLTWICPRCFPPPRAWRDFDNFRRSQ